MWCDLVLLLLWFRSFTITLPCLLYFVGEGGVYVCVCVCVCVCVSVCVCVYVRGASFKLGRPRSRGRKGFGRRRTGGGRSLKLGNFRWRHMCIVLDFNESFLVISKFETFVLHELIPQIISLTSLVSKSPKDYIIHLGKCLLFE